jgi:hypothetical protein
MAELEHRNASMGHLALERRERATAHEEPALMRLDGRQNLTPMRALSRQRRALRPGEAGKSQLVRILNPVAQYFLGH